ncbi:hypothetical protein K2Z84_12210 [Candidatus Binatia bacterium]|jgi:hypothetical protein|nr:hypothetical protein [Candidatus Binatia bacterium]
MKIQVRTRPDAPPVTGIVVTGPGGQPMLVVDGTQYAVHDRRLRELEVVSATDHERNLLKQQGYRIFRL